MYRVRQQDLPFHGSSHHFVGADNGDVKVSVFLLRALPGNGPDPHRHPYDEVQFVREGRGLWTVNGEEFVARRLGGEPLAWVTGFVRFCGLRVRVDPGVYVPRPHTQALARRAASLLPSGTT